MNLRKGFTLIEVLLTCLIAVVVIACLYLLWISTSRNVQRNLDRSEILKASVATRHRLRTQMIQSLGPDGLQVNSNEIQFERHWIQSSGELIKSPVRFEYNPHANRVSLDSKTISSKKYKNWSVQMVKTGEKFLPGQTELSAVATFQYEDSHSKLHSSQFYLYSQQQEQRKRYSSFYSRFQ